MHNAKKSVKTSEAALTKEHNQTLALEQELKDLRSHLSNKTSDSMLLPAMLVTAKPPAPPMQVVQPT